jgi:hypothetical protein
MESFTIDSLKWYKHVNLRYDIKKRFRVIATFLQEHSLTTRPLINSQQPISEDFSIHSRSLTEEGQQFVKLCYDRWVKHLDRGGTVDNVKILEDSLIKLRGIKS